MHLGEEEDTVPPSLKFIEQELQEGKFPAGFD